MKITIKTKEDFELNIPGVYRYLRSDSEPFKVLFFTETSGVRLDADGPLASSDWTPCTNPNLWKFCPEDRAVTFDLDYN